MKSRVTMKEIAKELQISSVTVSNAIAGKGGVSDALRKEILDKARELGYESKKQEKKSSDNTITIGFISSLRYISEGSSFYWEMYQNAVNAAAGKNALTMLEVFDESRADTQLPALVLREEIDGMIVIGRMQDTVMKQILEKAKGPVVLLDFYRPEYPCDAVLSNNYIGMYRATQYLIENGHRKIGFIGTGRTSGNVLARFFGFCKCMQEAGLAIDQKWLLEDRDLKTEEPHIILPAQLPTAFACSSDYTAGILYRELEKRGVRVPEDLSVIGYDDYLYGNTFSEKLTTYHVDMQKMAEKAVELVLKKIEAPRLPIGTCYIDSFLVERSSVKRLPTAQRQVLETSAKLNI